MFIMIFRVNLRIVHIILIHCSVFYSLQLHKRTLQSKIKPDITRWKPAHFDSVYNPQNTFKQPLLISRTAEEGCFKDYV